MAPKKIDLPKGPVSARDILHNVLIDIAGKAPEHIQRRLHCQIRQIETERELAEREDCRNVVRFPLGRQEEG